MLTLMCLSLAGYTICSQTCGENDVRTDRHPREPLELPSRGRPYFTLSPRGLINNGCIPCKFFMLVIQLNVLRRYKWSDRLSSRLNRSHSNTSLAIESFTTFLRLTKDFENIVLCSIRNREVCRSRKRTIYLFIFYLKREKLSLVYKR